MPRYTYIAKSQPQQTTQGNIEAETEEEAISKLTKMGYFPIFVSTEDLSLSKQGIFHLQHKASKKDIALFTRQLSSLIESGITIVNGLNIIYRQTANKYLKKVLADITDKIQDGKSLSDSLVFHSYLFSDLYSSMVRVGEASGNLKETLKRLADFLEKEEEFKSSLRAALTYPFFIFVVSAITILVLLVFVIPRLVTMFEDMGQILPLPTRILISTSRFLQSYGWLLAAGVSGFIFILRRLHRNPQYKVIWDNLKLKMALLGQIVLKTEISRLMRTLSLLLSSGIPITPSLEIAVSAVENQVLQAEIKGFKEQIANGASLSATFRNSKLFPELVNNIVAIGEETGSLEKSLLRIADDYEREIDRVLGALTRMLEPVIILAMGLIVGFIVLSMLLPIFQIDLIVR